MFFYYSYYILKYVVLHSAFRGGSSVFTKRPMAHLKWSIHNAKVPWKCCGPSCTIQMKWSSTDGRQCSYLIIITFCWILGYRKESWKSNVKGHMQHLDARHRTKNTAQKTTKISNTKPPRQKQNEKRIKPSCPWRVSSCCFLPFLFAVGFVSLNSF